MVTIRSVGSGSINQRPLLVLPANTEIAEIVFDHFRQLHEFQRMWGTSEAYATMCHQPKPVSAQYLAAFGYTSSSGGKGFKTLRWRHCQSLR